MKLGDRILHRVGKRVGDGGLGWYYCWTRLAVIDTGVLRDNTTRGRDISAGLLGHFLARWRTERLGSDHPSPPCGWLVHRSLDIPFLYSRIIKDHQSSSFLGRSFTAGVDGDMFVPGALPSGWESGWMIIPPPGRRPWPPPRAIAARSLRHGGASTQFTRDVVLER